MKKRIENIRIQYRRDSTVKFLLLLRRLNEFIKIQINELNNINSMRNNQREVLS